MSKTDQPKNNNPQRMKIIAEGEMQHAALDLIMAGETVERALKQELGSWAFAEAARKAEYAAKNIREASKYLNQEPLENFLEGGEE